MPLDCSCDIGDCDWYYESPEDFSTYARQRGTRCKSCRVMIRKGDTCGEFARHRPPNSVIEEGIYGDEVPLAPWFMCEECTGLFFSITETGCCISLDEYEPMRRLAEEYADLVGNPSLV